MRSLAATTGEFYVLGIVTAATAFCVIVLYPAFLARLAREVADRKEDRDAARVLGLFGVLVSAGVITFMAMVGFVFTYVLGESVNLVIGYVSPVAFLVLLLIGIGLVFGIKPSRKVNLRLVRNPYGAAFIYGFLFGAIVIPCNPGIIALAFARASVIPAGERMVAFLAFGVGIATPLLVFSLLSRAGSRWLINFLVDHKRLIDALAGIFMVGVSLYYLLLVFRVHETVAGWF